MSQARSVTAAFTAPVVTFALTVSAGAGNGIGSVSATNIGCSIALNGAHAPTATGTCSTSFNSGTNVTLTAIPGANGFTFEAWGGACAGSSTTCNVTMSQARSVTAKFNAPSLAAVQTQVFTPYCSGCHSTLNSAGNSSAYLVGVATQYRQPANPYPLATTYPTRVVAYDPDHSYTYYEIIKAAGSFGMPTGATSVPNSLAALFYNWIYGGAVSIQP
jgi:uncharacterized repeat protein (TIGR02543 family)